MEEKIADLIEGYAESAHVPYGEACEHVLAMVSASMPQYMGKRRLISSLLRWRSFATAMLDEIQTDTLH